MLLKQQPKTSKKETKNNMVKHVLFSFWDSQGLTTLGQRPGESRTRGAPRDSPWELGLSMEEGEAHHVCPEHHPSTAGFSLLALWKNFWKWLMFNLNVNTAKALSVPCIILQRPVYSFFFFFFLYQQCRKHLVNEQLRAVTPPCSPISPHPPQNIPVARVAERSHYPAPHALAQHPGTGNHCSASKQPQTQGPFWKSCSLASYFLAQTSWEFCPDCADTKRSSAWSWGISVPGFA